MKNSDTVYVPPSGNKFHYRLDCGASKNKLPSTIEQAKLNGYGECKSCKNNAKVEGNRKTTTTKKPKIVTGNYHFVDIIKFLIGD
jgi:hypothetical protein